VKPPFEPARLSDDPNAPDLLKSALSALGAERPDRRTLRRMRDSLGSQLEAPPPKLLDGWLAGAFGKSVVGLTLLAGLSALIGVSWRNAELSMAASAARPGPNAALDTTRPAPPSAAVTSALPHSPSPSETAPLTRKPSHAPRAHVVLASNPERRRDASSSPARRPSHAARHDTTDVTDATQDARQAAQLAASSDVAHASPMTAPAAASDAPARAHASAEALPPSAASDPEPKQAVADTSPRPAPAARAALDEPALLQGARRLARSQPLNALQLLAEHERRFPNGMLSAEREVLAIQLLRSLGRDAEAAQRAQAFRRAHPDSVYLRSVRAP
jgi:hypothetical protein